MPITVSIGRGCSLMLGAPFRSPTWGGRGTGTQLMPPGYPFVGCWIKAEMFGLGCWQPKWQLSPLCHNVCPLCLGCDVPGTPFESLRGNKVKELLCHLSVAPAGTRWPSVDLICYMDRHPSSMDCL